VVPRITIPGLLGVVQAGALDLGAGAGGGGVVDGQAHPPRAEQGPDVLPGADGHEIGLAARGADGSPDNQSDVSVFRRGG
jgi:hypothetical protein